jgi:hypothetical protein
MMMHYRGHGVGHKSTRNATNTFLNDHDPFDEITFWSEAKQNLAPAEPDPDNEAEGDLNGLRDTDSDLGEEEVDQLKHLHHHPV